MPKKPDRPIGAAHLGPPYITRTRFSTEKGELELQWAKTLTDALREKRGLKVTVRASPGEDDPADVILSEEGAEEILLQITEAVDLRRVEVKNRRRTYFGRVMKLSPEIRTIWSGVKIMLNDGGAIAQWPEPDSDIGKDIVRGIAQTILRLQSYPNGLPMQQPIGGLLQLSVDHCVELALTRYADTHESKPAQWYWGGPAWSIGEQRPPYVRQAAAKKIIDKKYSYPGGRFWLLVYTVDCQYDSDQEAGILADLAAAKHHFERVFLLSRGAPRQLFPTEDDAATAPGPPPRGGTILGDDAFLPLHEPDYEDL